MNLEQVLPTTVYSEPILVVEDESAVRVLLLRKLNRSGFEAVGVPNGMEALRLLREQPFGIVMSDINMPLLSGLELLQIIRETYPEIVVIMVTAYSDLDHAVAAMKLGASDYVVKPFDLDMLITAVRQAVQRRQRNITRRCIEAELKAYLRTESNQRLLLSTVMALANTLEAKDPYTVGHSQRVASLAQQTARQLGLCEDEIENIRLAGLLHDIGKVGIREAVINKPGPLSSDEYAHIQTHPIISERILQPVHELNGALRIIRHHHEHWDGNGYPDGLRGQEIPTASRILAVADAYDAMTSQRPYRPPVMPEAALREIIQSSGRHFDPTLSRLFASMMQSGENCTPLPFEVSHWRSAYGGSAG